jgi:hypothetical protein
MTDRIMDAHSNQRTFAEVIETIRARWPDALEQTPTDSPVFILAAGWRSGSTLLQRMLMPECFVWGEPYGHSCMLQQLAEPLRCITDDWPEPHFFYEQKVAVTLRRDEPATLDVASPVDSARQDVFESNGSGVDGKHVADGRVRDKGDAVRLITTERDGYVAEREGLSERFIANLYPNVATLLDAHRAYFDTLFANPARKANADHWGFKEVRLSADYAHYLKLLYPNSKILFLIRNPYDAYRSWAARRNAGWKWFYRWPDQPVTARWFGRLWTDLAGSFVEQAETLGAHVVRYEELKAGDYEPMEAYLGFELNRDAAKVRPADGPKPIDVIPQAELDELGDEMHALAEELGYPLSRMDVSSVRETARTKAPQGRTRRPSYEEARADLDPTRCVVLVPIGGSVVPACEEALAELERRGYQVRRVRGYSAIDQGRNQMATDAMADGFDETMWIDSDVGFDPDDIERLRQHNVPIVCGIYPQKGRRVLACHVLAGTEKLIFGDEGGLTEILYAGTGFLLVRREAYETIQRELQLPLCNERFGGRPMVPYFQPMSHPETVESEVSGHWYLAEDFAFCQRARQAGFTICADTRVRLMHYGNYGYSWEDAGMELQRYRTFHFHTK